jgi:hypothetical protein
MDIRARGGSDLIRYGTEAIIFPCADVCVATFSSVSEWRIIDFVTNVIVEDLAHAEPPLSVCRQRHPLMLE